MPPLTSPSVDVALERAVRSLQETRLPLRADVNRFFVGLTRALADFVFRVEQFSAPKDASRYSFGAELAILCASDKEGAGSLLRKARDEIRDSQCVLGIHLVAGTSSGVLKGEAADAVGAHLATAARIVNELGARPLAALAEMSALLPDIRKAALNLLSLENPRPLEAVSPRQRGERGMRPARAQAVEEALSLKNEEGDVQLSEDLALPLKRFMASLAVPQSEATKFYAGLAYAAGEFCARAALLVPGADPRVQSFSGNVLELFAANRMVAHSHIESVQSELRMSAVALLAHVARGEVSGFLPRSETSRLVGLVQEVSKAAELLRKRPIEAMEQVSRVLPALRDSVEQVLVIDSSLRPEASAALPTVEIPETSLAAVAPTPAPAEPPVFVQPGPALAPVPEPVVVVEDSSPFVSPEVQAPQPHSGAKEEATPATGPSGVHEYLRDGFGFSTATVEAIEARLIRHGVSDDLLLDIEKRLGTIPREILLGLVDFDPKLFPMTCEQADELGSRLQAAVGFYTTKGISRSDALSMFAADPRFIFKAFDVHRSHADTLRQLRLVLGCGEVPMTAERLSGAQLLPAAVNATLREERGRKRVRK